jgi:hypothetical protein
MSARILSRLAIATSLAVAGCAPPAWDLPDDIPPPAITRTVGGNRLGGLVGGAITTPRDDSGSTGSSPASAPEPAPADFACGSPRSGTSLVPVTTLTGAPDGVALTPVSSSPVRLEETVRTALVITSTGAFPSPWDVAWTGSTGLAFRLPESGSPPGTSPDRQGRGEQRIAQITRAWLARPAPRRVQNLVIPVYAGPGSQRTFQMIDGLTGGAVPVSTEAIQDVSLDANRKLIVWADRRDLSQVRAASQAIATVLATFRDHIYPLETCAFGPDPLPPSLSPVPETSPVLADGHVHLVFSSRVDAGPAEGLLGYFTIADLVGTASLVESNQAKALHLATSTLSRNMGDLLAVVAHEFQHLLFSCHRIQAVGRGNHVDEFADPGQTWLNEGLSMQAMLLAGYGPEGRTPSPAIISQVADYLAEPDRYSMTGFSRSSGNPTDAYGMVTLFFDYLVNRLGDEILASLHDPARRTVITTPTGLLDPILASRGTSFDSLFADFGVALAVDDAPTFRSLPAELRARLRIPGVNLYRGSDGVTAGYTGLDGPTALAGPAVRARGAALSTDGRSRVISLQVTRNLEAGQQLSGPPPRGVTARILTVR